MMSCLRSKLVGLAALLLVGCGASLETSRAATPSSVEMPAAPMPAKEPSAESAGVAMSTEASFASLASAPSASEPSTDAPAVKPAVEEPSAGSLGGQPVSTAVTPSAIKPRKMLDIEARLTIEVEQIRAAAQKLRELTLKSNGDVISESIIEQGGAPHATFTLRVPASAAADFLAHLEGFGAVRSRVVEAKDIGKEFFDTQLRLRNLHSLLARYEAMLGRASTVGEIMQVEQEINRIRGQIEQVEGQLRWMRDRAARATIYVTLQAPGTYVEPPVIIRPTAKFYPGVRLSYLLDIRQEGNSDLWGAGLSVRFSRHFGIDVEGARFDVQSGGLDAFLLTLGGETYSEFFGNGNSRWLNPYLGLRAGYSRFQAKNEIVLGGTLGIELLKTEAARLDAEVRGLALFGSDAGAHVIVQPALGVNVAF